MKTKTYSFTHRATSLLLCVVMFFSLIQIMPTQAYADYNLNVYCDGNPTAAVTLPQNDKVKLTAINAQSGSASYQWQILAYQTIWVDINGADGLELELSYAMIANLLTNGSALIRCEATADGEHTYSPEVTVTVDYNATPVFDTQTPDTEPIVVSEAETVGEAVITAPSNGETANGKKSVSAESVNGKGAENDIQADGEATDPPVTTTYTIVINYVFLDEKTAASSWAANVAAGSSYRQTVNSPVVLGYSPDKPKVDLDYDNIQANHTETVTYSPADVNYTVIHYKQNINDDNYVEAERETKTGKTESNVGKNLNTTYTGFYSLLYDTETVIAADGSTEVEIYYDRYYYLMSFDLDGGYGVEPIYAKFGTPISVGEPTKAGYTFNGWTLISGTSTEIPKTMPAENSSYKASWTANGGVTYTVAFWYENADDDNYTSVGSISKTGTAGDTVESNTNKDEYFDGKDASHFTYNSGKNESVTINGDGSTVLNVYYTRNQYTLTFVKGNGDQILVVTQKYDSDIKNIWTEDPIKTYLNKGYVFKSSETSDYYSFLEKMPGKDITMTATQWSGNTYTWYYYLQVLDSNNIPTEYTIKVDNGVTYYLYSTTKLKGGDIHLTYAEDYYPITGFTQRDNSVPEFNKSREAYLYYTRNSYSLSFYNYNAVVEGKGGTKLFEEDISGTGFDPDYPNDLEVGAYVFDAWYTSPYFGDTKFVFTNATMPASDLMLYAHWVKVTHTVNTYTTNQMTAEQLLNTQTVTHGSTAKKPDDPENGDYTFVGWFYMDGTQEKAFDFSMPVNKDLDLYAKWSSNVLKEYTIHYTTKDGTPIADDTTGSALAGTTKTFDAKAGDELYNGYQTGYYPQTNSHSITIDIDNANANVYTFIYVPREKVNYTVKYLEVGTNKVLYTEKSETTTNAVITETYQYISGYAPDAYQKRLVLSADESENVITFWYTVDNVHAPVQIIHYVQNVSGDNYTEYQSSNDPNGEIGKNYSTDILTIAGFEYNHATADGTEVTASNGTVTGAVTAQGLVLKLYYNRIKYPYEFQFLEQGTDKVLADPVKDSAMYGSQVTQIAKEIPGYTCDKTTDSIIIQIEDPAETAVKNVRIFYYTENEVNITYQVVGPAGAGSVNPTSEKVKVFAETAIDSTPTANNGYRFVGWYTNDECTIPVNLNWVNENNKLTPQKNHNYGTNEEEKLGFIDTTYYAKFEYALADLTVSKTGADKIDENQSFIFRIVGDTSDAQTNGIDLRVVINIAANRTGGSVTVKDLPIGSYTVTEESGWSWRYTPTNGEQPITLSKDTNSVTFANSRTSTKWLNGSAYCENIFA